jgi:2-iminobutanoate/2-iminopropanoate deaminase
MADFAKVNEEYAKFFKNEFPARVCIAVHQLPRAGRYFNVYDF